MDLEIRVKNMEEAYELMKSRVDIIAVGDENCVYKVPKYEAIKSLVDNATEYMKKIRVVFPKIPNEHFDRMLKLLTEVASLDILVTINDYGLMFMAKDINLLNGFTVGRNLAFSLLSSPWYDLLVEEENQEMRKALATSNMESTYKLDFVKQLGANEIEIEFLKEVCDSTQAILKSDFKIAAHYESCLVAYGRCCPVKKIMNEKTNTCNSNISCQEPFSIEYSEKFVSIPVQDKDRNYSASTHFVKDEQVKEVFPTLFVIGNGLYRKNTKNNFEHKIISTMIINSSFYDSEQEEMRIVNLLASK